MVQPLNSGASGQPDARALLGNQWAPGRKLSFLYVEDSEDDGLLLQRAIRKAQVPIHLQIVRSAAEAVACLKTMLDKQKAGTGQIPDLVLVDMGLPDGSGLEVLDFVRSTPELRRLPLIVLTGRQEPELRGEAYQRGANSFLQKPHTMAETQALVWILFDVWGTASLPWR